MTRRQDALPTRHIAAPTGVAKAQQSRPKVPGQELLA